MEESEVRSGVHRRTYAPQACEIVAYTTKRKRMLAGSDKVSVFSPLKEMVAVACGQVRGYYFVRCEGFAF